MNMLYGTMGNNAPPADENIVRMTTAPVDVTKAPAVMDDPPMMGEVETDPDPMLGMATRQVASDWHQGEKYAPFWADNVSQQAVNSVPIDSTVSSAGMAPALEKSGTFGHGSMSFAVGIEPAQGLAPGGQYGNEYFAVPKPPPQEGMGNYMTMPPGYAHGAITATARQGAEYARDAYQESKLYDLFLNGPQG